MDGMHEYMHTERSKWMALRKALGEPMIINPIENRANRMDQGDDFHGFLNTPFRLRAVNNVLTCHMCEGKPYTEYSAICGNCDEKHKKETAMANPERALTVVMGEQIKQLKDQVATLQSLVVDRNKEREGYLAMFQKYETENLAFREKIKTLETRIGELERENEEWVRVYGRAVTK
jgi:hypothetical protein